MTVADDLATLRDILESEWPGGLVALDRVEAEIARLERERDTAAVENASLRAALEGHEPSIWAERMLGRMADAEIVARAEAAEAEAARLAQERDELRESGQAAARALDRWSSRHAEENQARKAAEAEAARLRDGLRRIELWPVDVGHTPEHDLLQVKEQARALLAEEPR